MVLELIAEFDPFLQEHIRQYGNKGSGTTSYLSANICEEVLKIMADRVLRKIVTEILISKYWSMSVDSTPDKSHIDQLTFIIRYVSENGKSVERFIKFIPNCDHTGEAISNTILKTLKTHEIDIKDCRGQSYDNASNMSGIYKGVQARITAINPLAEWIPCAAHFLNLVGSNSIDSNPIAGQLFLNLQALYNFFKDSNKRWDFLHKKLLLTIKNLSVTRWSARYDACKTLAQSFQIILNVLLEISKNNKEKSKTRSEAKGLYDKLNCLEICFMSLVWYDILERFNTVSMKLQSTKTELCTVVDLYESLIEYLSFLRYDFENYEKKLLKFLVVIFIKKM